MRAIMIMFDSLNRHMLPPYGCEWIHAPNFARLAEHTVTFDNSYVGSMPCMPARRELHTGRLNFLHRSWGPMEPYDDSMPRILKEHGVHSHLVSDHWHYWEEGGANYHTKYSTFEWARGQEGDFWKGHLAPLEIPDYIDGRYGQWGRQEHVNRYYMREEKNQSQAVTFQNGLEFLETNKNEDNWFLQLEEFDPHEPFFTPEKYQNLYPSDYKGRQFDWPAYHTIKEAPDEVAECIRQYSALLSMCDEYLGKVLDVMDKYNMWENTMLIVNTDHGFLLSEHDWWGKVMMPFYNEIAHTPLFMWDPRSKKKGERRQALVQTIDFAPTILEYFGIEIPPDMQGFVLKNVIDKDEKVRDYALFGMHGCHVNITDGQYVYMRATEGGVEKNDDNLFNYTLMPAHMKDSFDLDELRGLELSDGFSFTKGVKLMRVRGTQKIPSMGFPAKTLYDGGHLLYDINADEKQLNPINDKAVEDRMIVNMIKLMKENDSPKEQFVRLGLQSYL